MFLVATSVLFDILNSVLSDFFIGAHAAVEGWTLLTRDATRIRSYFPTVALIAP